MRKQVENEKILRVLQLEFDDIDMEDDEYTFVRDGVTFARIGVSRFSDKQKSLFNSLRNYDIRKYDKIK